MQSHRVLRATWLRPLFILAALVAALPAAADARAARTPLDAYTPLRELQDSGAPAFGRPATPAASLSLPNSPLLLQSILSGDWTPEREVFPPDYYALGVFAVELDSQGYPVVVFVRQDPWHQYDWVLFWTRYTGASWTSVSRVSPLDNSFPVKPRLALGEDGRLWLVWNNLTSGGIWYAVLDAGHWSNPARVNPPDAYAQYSPIVAQGGGAVWCAWYGTSATGHHYDVFVTKWTGAAWSPPENLTVDIPGWHWFVDLKVDSQGQPHLVWGNSDVNRVYFTMKPANGNWVAPEQVSETPVDGWPQCRLALDEWGGDHVVWATQTADLAYAHRPSGGAWAHEQILHRHWEYGISYPAIACGGGRVCAVWGEIHGDTEDIFATEPGGSVEQLDQGLWWAQQTPEIVAGTDSLRVFWSAVDDSYEFATILYSNRAMGSTVSVPISDGPGVGARLTATPNPFRTGVKLAARNLPAGDLVIDICSVTGRVVHREPAITGFAGGHAELQLAGLGALPAGMYFARLRVGAQSVSTKLVKLD